MNRQALLVLPLIAAMVVSGAVASYAAPAAPAAPSTAPATQGAVSQTPAPSGEFASGWHHKPSLEAMLKKLGITDEQKKQIRALYVGFLDRTRKTRMELKSLKDEKRTMLLSGKIDQQKLAQMDDQTVKLVSDLLREKLKLRRDRLALLTPEQIGRIADWQAEKAFSAKWKKVHERRHGGF